MDIEQIIKKSISDLKSYWSLAFLASLPLSLLPSFLIFDKTIGLLIILVFTGPLRTCLSKTSLSIINKEPIKLNAIFDGFLYFKTSLGVFLILMILIALGLIYFIIPRIIITIWLSQSFFILIDNPDLEPLDIFKKSKEMIKGQELNYFYLLLGFTLLSVLFVFINLVFISLLLVPIQYVVMANFYNSLKKLNTNF